MLMKRVAAVLVMTILVPAWGCGKRSYEDRLDFSLKERRYRERLDQQLLPAPLDPRFKDFPLYIRPPKDMPLATQFMIISEAELPLGQFDLAASFGSQGSANLHVLARRKTSPKAAAKDGAPQPIVAAEPQRPFDQEVLAILGRVYPADALQSPKFDSETKKTNQFRRLIFNSPNGNFVRVYLYKREPYDVALIWDTPAAQNTNAGFITARDLTLQSFAVGRRAGQYFSGSMNENEGGETAPSGGGAGGEGSATKF
jgi:hypothetical protein